MNKKLICLLSILIISSIKLCAQQQFDIVNYSTSKGLSNSCVYNLYQDKKGFLWIPTEYGLNKFDGNSFKSYDFSNGFPENITLSCTDGPNNELLVGTFSKGIIQIQSDGTIKKLIDPLNRAQITKLVYTDSLIYAFSKPNACTYNYKSQKVTYFDSNDNSDTVVNVIAQFGKELLVGTDEGLFLFSEKKKIKINTNNLIKNINAIYNTNNHLWIATKGVIYKLNSSNFSIKDSIVFDINRKNSIDCILQDNKENLWFSTILPISLYKTTKSSGYKSFENISEKLNIGSTDINSLLMDREKNIWVATYNKGLFCIKNTFLYTNSYFKDAYINSIFIDKNGNSYIGCIDGISVLNAKKKEWSKINADKNKREYTYGFVEKNETVYFLTNGTYPEYYTLKKNDRNIVKVAARTILFLNDSIALFGGWQNHIDIRKKNKYKFDLIGSIILEKSNIKNNRVNDIAKDKKGIIWCATDLGIYKIDTKNKQSQKATYDTTSTKINDIVIDKNNAVWFAAENFVLKYDQHKWQQFNELNQQKLGIVNSLAVDNKNRLYIGTLKGMHIIENGISNYLDDKSGLTSNEINKLTFDSINNNILIATNDSYSELNIDQYEQFKKLPLSINITSVYINDSLTPLSKEYLLNYKQNNIRLNFVAINLTFPRSVRYQYQIDNGTWLNLQSNTLELASLKYGYHYINIRASLDNKKWCKPETVLINVSTPIYLTLRFWLIIIISFLLISFFAVQFRIKLIQKKANEKYLIQKQLEELKFKSLNASINPHFIFNSLNSIQNYINHNDKNKASNYLGKFARLIRLVLDKANEKEITIKEEIQRLTFYIQLEQDRFGNGFTFTINADKQVYGIIIPNMIIQPIVENAILHGIKDVENAHIEISFEKHRDILTITVDDNGIGIDSTKKTTFSDHKSMAIDNIKERLALYPTSSLAIIDKKHLDVNTTGTLAVIKLQL